MAAEPAAADRLRAVPAPEAEIEETHAKLRGALRFGLYAVLLLSPLPFGSVQPWAVLVLELSAALLGAGALAVLLTGARDDSRPPWLPLALAGALVVLGVAQALPGGWGRTAAPGAAARAELATFVPESAPPTAPWSLAPPETVDATARLTAYVLLALAAFVAFRRDEHLVTLAVVIVASALFQAIYGSGEYLSGRDSIFAYKKKYYLDSATGTFINRNHFAGYLAMAASFIVMPTLYRLVSGTTRRRVRAAAILGSAGTMLLWLAILLSRSRGGLLAFCVAILAAWLLVSRYRIRLLLPAMVLIAPVIFLLWRDVTVPGARFGALEDEFTSEVGRWTVWQESLHLALQHPVIGSGLGTFAESYFSKTRLRTSRTYDHAHNEYVQAIHEGGAVAFSLTILAAAVLSSVLLRRTRTALTAGWGVTAASTGLLSAILHASFDFPQRIPAVAVLSSILAGVVLRARTSHAQSRTRDDG